MKIVIFGASGMAGKAVLKKALDDNHQITVLTRNAKNIVLQHQNLTIIEGSVMDKNKVYNILKGQNAVIQCLGIGGKGNGKPTTIVSDASKIIIAEMEKLGIKRYIAMSVIGAGNSIAFLPAIFRKIIPYLMKWLQAIIDDANRMESMITNSNLDWTIVRSTTLKEKPATGKITATLDGKNLKFSITTSDLATFIIAQLHSNIYLKQTPTISN